MRLPRWLRPSRLKATPQAQPPVRATTGVLSRPAGFIEYGALPHMDGTVWPVLIRRGRPDDAQAFARWPEPTWFDWVGLAQGRKSGRDVKGHVDFNAPCSLVVLEAMRPDAGALSIVGGLATRLDRSGPVPDLQVCYLERAPHSQHRGIGKILLAAALFEAARHEATLSLEALLRSNSDLFYRRCGLVESGRSLDPGMTRRMVFPDQARALKFLESCRREGLLP